MSPVGSYESLMAAIQGGANSIYFGVGKMNMRSRSSVNFTLEDLAKISAICRENNLKSYLTVNTIVYDNEIEEMQQLVDAAKENQISAVIASDISVMEYALSISMPVHISTQCNITNISAVSYFSRYADVMVLARELTIEQVADITRKIQERNITGPSGNLVRIEVFAHGALCMAVSGKCYLSLDNMNFSANRGSCLQLCRRSYIVTDKEEGFEFEVDNEYIMSPKDLCTISFLDKLKKAGITVLKIEGRGRPAEYVKTVTRCYSEAVKAMEEGTYNQEKIDAWTAELSKVFNRGFWDGYYLGRKMGEWSDRYGSQAKKIKIHLGKITNYFSNLGVAEVKVEAVDLQVNSELLIIGPTTGVMEICPDEIRVDLEKTEVAVKGQLCSIKVPDTVRRGDKVYLLKENEF